MDLRPQAHDIIRTWAFVTITRSYLEDGSIPWYHAAISGFVLDPDRKKMSKSKGNVVVPTDTLDEFGSDAIRYWAGSARLGWDAAADPNVFREGKRLVTKIRNAARLINGFEGESGSPDNPLDKALLARLRSVIEHATANWEKWSHVGALEAVEGWFWSDLTDNYLELVKARAYAQDPSALGTLRLALQVVLRLFAPILPFVTEEVWNLNRSEPSSIHRTPWPTVGELPATEDDGSFDAAVEVLTQVRRAKSEAKVSIKTPVEMLEVRGPEARLQLLRSVLDDVLATGNVRARELTADDSSEELAVRIELGEPEAKR
jgi:valyl-tRNA synthetase